MGADGSITSNVLRSPDPCALTAVAGSQPLILLLPSELAASTRSQLLSLRRPMAVAVLLAAIFARNSPAFDGDWRTLVLLSAVTSTVVVGFWKAFCVCTSPNSNIVTF